MSSTLAYHDSCMSQAADALFGLHAHLTELRSPMLDVASAMEVLSQHTYARLPRAIQFLRHDEPHRWEEDGSDPANVEQDEEGHGEAIPGPVDQDEAGEGEGTKGREHGAAEQGDEPGEAAQGRKHQLAEDSAGEAACKSHAGPLGEGAGLEALVWRKLLEVPRPPQLSSVRVHGGRATLRVDGEYEADVTVGYANRLDLWRLLDVRLLVGPRAAAPSPPLLSTAPPAGHQLSLAQKMFLADDVQRRMAAECLQATPPYSDGASEAHASGSSRGGDPLGVLHSTLHALASAVACDQVLTQLRELELLRWKGHIRVEISSAAACAEPPDPTPLICALDSASAGPGSPGAISVPGTPVEPASAEGSAKRARAPGGQPAGDGDGSDKAVVVEVSYWLASEEGGAQAGQAAGAAAAGAVGTKDQAGGKRCPPCIRMELLPAPSGPGRSLRAQLRCSHFPAVVDPLSPVAEGPAPDEAALALDPVAIDMERLLQDAIRCSTHSKLVVLQRSLRSEAAALGLLPSDILLTFSGQEAEGQQGAPAPGLEARGRNAVELLWVRLLGSGIFLRCTVALRCVRGCTSTASAPHASCSCIWRELPLFHPEGAAAVPRGGCM